MIKLKKDNVDIYNPIENKKTDIIEAYVQVYGEQYRETIESQMNNTEFICLFGGGEDVYLGSALMTILSAKPKVIEIIKEQTGIDVSDASSLTEEDKAKLNKCADYKLFCRAEQIYDAYNETFNSLDESTNDCRYKELYARLEAAGIKDLDIAAKSIWGWAKDSITFSIDRTISLPLKDKTYKQFCFLNNGFSLENSTATHESGHIIETFIIKQKGDKALEKSGFELNMQGSTDGIEYNHKGKKVKTNKKRRYQAFNEIVGDYISIKVAKILKDKNVVVGLKEDDYEHTEYSAGFEVFGNFIDNNLEKIIECKMSKTGDEIGEFFGFENFNMLADLATQYLENAYYNRDNKELGNQILDLLDSVEKRHEVGLSKRHERD